MQPLYLGVVPAEHTAGVVAALVAAIHNQTDHINCGIIGSRFLLDVLTKHGHGDLALTLATTKTCPGWGYMVEQQKGDPHDTPGTMWETWQDIHVTGSSKNHPALGAGIGLWLYQLAGIAEDSTPDALILQPLRETVETVGSAELSLATPQGAVEFSWRHVPACKDLHVAGGWVAGLWAVDGFEANVTLPLQLPTPPQVHLPLPRSTREGLPAAASALEQRVEIREVGCDCVVWPEPAGGRARSGVLSVALAASPAAARLGAGEDTVVLELVAGSYAFRVAAAAE